MPGQPIGSCVELFIGHLLSIEDDRGRLGPGLRLLLDELVKAHVIGIRPIGPVPFLQQNPAFLSSRQG